MKAAVNDARWMALAVRLGHRALGTTGENPPVGCVIVREGRLVGLGCTASGGRPHAETEALAMAGKLARAATAYVTLEPCAHHGRTPPCAEALVAAWIGRLVVACDDPDPRVAGRGYEIVRRAGIPVETGLGRYEAERDLAGFFSRIVRKRPYVILKLAISADGKLAAMPGRQTAITGPEVKARVHMMRAQSDAILVGRRTVEVDDPELTCRLPGLEQRSPVRVVLASSGNLPPASRLAETASRFPVWLLAGKKHYEKEGVVTILCKTTSTGVDIAAALELLAARGINRLMVEGGAAVAQSFLASGLVDEAHVFRSRVELGPQGVAAPLGLLAALNPIALEMLGADSLTVYQRA